MAARKTEEQEVQEQAKVTMTVEELEALIDKKVKTALESADQPVKKGQATIKMPPPPVKKVKIKLFKDNDKYKDPIYASVNGENFIIPRGVEVEVPDYIAEVVQRSIEEDQKTAAFIKELEDQYEEETRRI